MAVYYYPFESHETGDESNPYDRAITAEQERMFNKLRYVNGVFNPDGGALRVTSNSNMTVTVGTGGCHIEGAIAYNDAPITLQIEAADATLNRIDRVVAQFNTSDSVRAISILVRTGTAATNPIAPELRTEPNLYEIALADVYVGKNVSSIGTANITDLRLNSDLCGQVVPAIPTPLDLTGIYDQYQASLNEWLDTVASALDETLAGNLQSQITDLANTLQEQITYLDAIAPNGIVDILHGGTGATTVAGARNALGLGNTSGALPIENGGTGKTTAAEALVALGIEMLSSANSSGRVVIGKLGIEWGTSGTLSLPANSNVHTNITFASSFKYPPYIGVGLENSTYYPNLFLCNAFNRAKTGFTFNFKSTYSSATTISGVWFAIGEVE